MVRVHSRQGRWLGPGREHSLSGRFFRRGRRLWIPSFVQLGTMVAAFRRPVVHTYGSGKGACFRWEEDGENYLERVRYAPKTLSSFDICSNLPTVAGRFGTLMDKERPWSMGKVLDLQSDMGAATAPAPDSFFNASTKRFLINVRSCTTSTENNSLVPLAPVRTTLFLS